MGSSSRQAVNKVAGLNNLKRSLKAAGVELSDLKEAHAEAARTVIQSAMPWVPRSPAGSNRGPSGTLAASVRGSGQAGAAVVRAGRASVPYANPIHWGWPSRGIKARPFLWTAIHKSQDEWSSDYLAALERLIQTIEGAPGP